MDNAAKAALELEKIDANIGLPEEVFLSVSTLVPIANVDLLILDSSGRILLSWREDPYFGKGWHIPGGCIRFRETMEERIQKTALEEIGTQVIFKDVPAAVKNIIMNGYRKGISNQDYRAHQIAVLFECSLPRGFQVKNNSDEIITRGYLKWFKQLPENLLRVHDVYLDILAGYGLRKEKQG